MKKINKLCDIVGTSVLILTFVGILGMLAFDALEYETTGECKDCLLLNKIRNI